MKKTLLYAFLLLVIAGPAFGAAGKYALLIGVSDYQHSAKDLPDLKGPINDVHLIRKEVLPLLGYKPDQIVTLTGRKATRKNIERAVRDFAGAAGVDERFFFFAGHGSYVEDVDGDERDDGRDEVILPYDARYDGDGKLIPETVVRDDDLKAWFAPLEGKKLFAVLDSCHSGTGFRTMDPRFNATRSRFAPNRGLRRGGGGIGRLSKSKASGAIESGDGIPEGHIYLYAARSDRPAKEKKFNGAWQGCFTRAFRDAVQYIAAASPESNSYLELYRTIDSFMKDRMDVAQPPAIQPRYRGSRVKLYRHTDSERLLGPFLNTAESATAEAPTLETRLPDIDDYRTRVLIRQEGGRAKLNAGDFSSVRPYADIDFGDQGGGYNLYAAIDGNAREVSLVNENGYRLNVFSYMGKTDLVKALSKRIRHQYLKDLLVQIESKKGFPLSLRTLYRGRDYDRNDFFGGQEITYLIESDVDAYVYVLSVDAGGEFNIYLPFELQPDNRISRGGKLLLPDKRICGYDVFLEITQVPGEEIVKVIASNRPLRIEKAKIRDMGDEEYLTQVNFDQALDTIKSLLSQLDRRTDWYAGTKRFMNYARSDYQRMYQGQ